ncbi:MAG TPA: hypothetical protein VMN39_01110 [Longimicrobiaceae bacterium]|nr:hypothetical protein [Longimicrobiaceae bacterium]
MAEEERDERPFEGGAQPVSQHRAEVPHVGRTVGQTIVIAIAIVVVLAAILWLVVPFGG